MSSGRKHKSAVMTAEVTPGTSVEVEKAIADEEANVAVPAKKMKEDKSKSSETVEDIDTKMKRTFDERRKLITVDLPTIADVKEQYPDLFKDRQFMLEFQRITDIDLDRALQEYCVNHWNDVTAMCQKSAGAAVVLKNADEAKKENDSLTQYWDMVTALCLIPHMLSENMCDLVIEIAEDEPVDPKGKIVPVLISRGNIFKSDEFFLIAEEEIVQVFEEFTIAFASLFATYWIFNMEYPQTLVLTYNFIQKVMINHKDGTPTPLHCKELQAKLVKSARQRHMKEKNK